ncbi:MAG: PAS domain S-box protein, partial [Rubrobacteraceae bacterium]
GEVLFQTDAEGHYVFLNSAWEGITGFTVEESLGKSYLEFIHPDDLQRNLEDFEQMGEHSDEYTGYEARFLAKDGSPRDVEIKFREHFDAQGNLISTSGTINDITERKRAEEELAKSEERFRSLVQNASDLITVVDAGGIITYESPSKERILGYGPQELVGRSVLEHVHPDDLEYVSTEFVNVLSHPRYLSEEPVEFWYRHADGTWRYLESLAANLLEDPGVGSIVITSRDLTERKKLEEQLSYQAFHDPLTGLPNRSSLQRDFERATSYPTTRPYDYDDPSGDPPDDSPSGPQGGSQDGSLYMGILFLDLDGFKRINDSMGHETGDKLLQAVAERLKSRMRAGDSVARLGGDEFCVLLAGISDSAEAIQIAERLKASLETPFSIPTGVSTDNIGNTGNNSSRISLSASIGIAVGKLDDNHSLDELLREADAAMYRTKKRGGDLYEIVELKESTG